MNVQAIKQRIAYERTYGLGERIERAKDKACLWIARRIPERLGMWVVVHRHAQATPHDRHPGDVKAFDLYGKAA